MSSKLKVNNIIPSTGTKTWVDAIAKVKTDSPKP